MEAIFYCICPLLHFRDPGVNHLTHATLEDLYAKTDTSAAAIPMPRRPLPVPVESDPARRKEEKAELKIEITETPKCSGMS